MRFLALSPAASWALIAGVALVILLLHLLKPPSLRVVVPSLLLWARVIQERKRPGARRLMLLLLALGAGVSLALALTRPEIPAIGASAQRFLLILDNAPSMAARTRDGRSRWQHALEQARVLLQESGATSEVMLADTSARLRMGGFVDRGAAVTALAQLPAPAWRSAHVPPMPLASGVQVHLFTDGVATVDVPEQAIVHSVFEPADNVAVTAFEARPLAQDPTRYEALVQVLNASPGDHRVLLLITGENHFSITQDLDLRAGETVNANFDVSDFEGGVLGAAVVFEQDAYPSDDLAYAVVPPHRARRVLLVTPGNPPLEDALRSLPGVRLSVIAPDRYSRSGEHDAAVFDRFAPAEPPATGALLLRPPLRKWLAGHSAALTHPRITSWNEGHEVTRGIAWRNLRLASAALSRAPRLASDALVLASGSESGAVVTAGHSQARWIQVGFALQDSNFPLQPDFPVFLGNALNWVNAPIPVLARGLGSVEVALPGAIVHDGSGNSVAVSATPQGVVFEASRVDVYTVSAPGGQILVVANVDDPRCSQINRTRLGGGDATALKSAASTRSWNAELWVLLLLFAGALLFAEWAVFTRPRIV